MEKISVSNMYSPNGNQVPNQFEIRTDKGIYFQSYQSMIAFREYGGDTILDEKYWDWSRTTGKYRNMFLREDKKTTERKIKNGEYKLADLN